MKISKRLLSILLMLVMLVSVFTVMAFADEKVKITDCKEAHNFKSPDENDTHFDAVTATCIVKGTPEYYQCHVCGGYYWNGSNGVKSYNPKTSTYAGYKTDPSNHVALKQYYAEKASCTQPGNKAYSYCSDCNTYFDELGKETTQEAITIGATGHDMLLHDATLATCTKRGTKEYWECKNCHKFFADQNGENEMMDITVPTIPHKGVLVSGKAATCTDVGLKPAYYCSGCETYYQDEACTTEATENWRKIPALGHTLTHVAAKAPTETEDGNIEYWYCSVCQKYFNAEAAAPANEITEAGTILRKTGFTLHIEKVDADNSDSKVYYRIKGTTKWQEVTGDTTISGLKKNDSYEVKAEPDKNYEAAWKIDNKVATVASNQKTIQIIDASRSVKITFTKIETKKLTLTLDLSGTKYGKLKYWDNDEDGFVTCKDGKEWDLKEGQKVEFKAYPESGYKAVWWLGSGSKTTLTRDDISYSDMNGKDRTLHVEFVKKGTTVDDNYPTLTFDITGAKHGTVTRNNNYKVSDGDVISIKKNDTRTFEAKPDKGYVAVWTFQGETYVGNKYTLKMGSKDATLYIEFMDEDDYRLTKLPFRDVSEKDWYYDDVVYVYRNGLMEGVSSTKFAPSQNTTRGQIVTILWRLTGEPRAAKENKFTDVSYDAYYNKAISWAAEAGIVEGFDAKTFKPDQNVTREQLAAILYRYASYMNLSTKGASNLTKFDDYNKIGTWARDAMAWANYHGLINGVSYSRIDPKGYATRAQIAAILHRFAVEFRV